MCMAINQFMEVLLSMMVLKLPWQIRTPLHTIHNPSGEEAKNTRTKGMTLWPDLGANTSQTTNTRTRQPLTNS